MTLQAWLVLAVVAGAVAAMVRGRPSDLTLLAAITLLMGVRILTPEEALSGFSNEGMLTVAALFVVTAALRETGALDAVVRSLLGRPKTVLAAQMRLMFPVAGVSAFVNNTPLVALMVPIVSDWAKQIRVPPSKLMIPLSYAAVLSGACTLIGTSTNLVVSGLAAHANPPIAFSLFDPLKLGLSITVVGFLYVFAASRWLLPSRGVVEEGSPGAREYMVATRVEGGSSIVGKSIESAGLRHLPGLFLVEIHRNDEVLPAVDPKTRLLEGDQLLFAGVIESVVDLLRIRGLVPATDQLDKLLAPRPDRQLVEAVVSARSTFSGMTIREIRFRTKYDAAVIAVHRGGERLRSKVGDIVLRPGDVLLVEAHPSFSIRNRHDKDFALFREVAHSAAPRYDRAWIASAVAVGMILVNALGFMPIVTASFLAAFLVLLFGCLTAADALEAIEPRVLLTIAGSFALGTALDKTGVASTFAMGLVGFAGHFGTAAIVAGVYLSTALLTELITNNSAAALMFPLCLETARVASLPAKPLLLVLMMAASASFSTPIGYQTNLMVYGPGHYRFTDFLRFGVPMQILVGAVTVAVVMMLWF